MMFRRYSLAITFLATCALVAGADKIDAKSVRTGKDAWANATSLKPGTARKITTADLPQPSEPSRNFGQVIKRPENAWPQAPEGFKVDLYVDSGLGEPRQIRTAPNGDFFVADSSRGEIRIFRGITKEGKPEQSSVFATGLNRPF